MAKNNTGLVEYARAQLGKPYWFGTFGQLANAKVWAENKKRYPNYYSDKRKGIQKDRGDEGKKVHDCSGLIKGYMMSKSADMPAIYDGKYDLSADAMYNKATEKGTIDTIPEIAGLGLWKKGHVGIYILGGQEIEARGFDYGVLQDAVKNTAFTHWFKIPFIDYEEASANQPAPEAPEMPQKSLEDIAGEVIRGQWGNDPERSQRLSEAGYDPKAVQAIVNEKLGISQKPAEPSTWTGIVVTKHDPLRVRSQRNLSCSVVKLLPKGSEVELKGEAQDGFYTMADDSGYVSSIFIKHK